MYDIKNKPSFSVRKAMAQKRNSRQKIAMNLPGYHLRDTEVMQQRPSSYLFDQNTMQLRREEAKLVASTYGTDPSGLGLTAHHIIPSSLLEWFYDICKQKQNLYMSPATLCNALRRWEDTSVKYAEMSKEHRDNGMDLDHKDDPDYPNMVKSACVWMNGNIFIGPSTDCRLDDVGDIFDYGGYRSSEIKGIGQSSWTDVSTGNKKMNVLAKLYDELIYIKQESQKPAPSPSLDNDIIHALESLADLAGEDHTLHKKEGSEESTSAYNPNDWICVGNQALLGGKNKAKLKEKTYTFIEMYNSYLRYKRTDIKAEQDIWQNFCKLFKENIKTSKAHQIWEDNSISCIMSKHTYAVLYTKWKECLGKSKKR